MNKNPVLLFLFGWLLMLIACGTEDNNTQQVPAAPTMKVIPQKPKSAELKVAFDHFRIRATAGSDGEVIGMLQTGDVVKELDEVSEFTTPISLRGVQYDEPWIKVRAKDGTEGWIYGGGVHYTESSSSRVVQLLRQKRLETFFNKKLTQQIDDYTKAYRSANTPEAFAKTYKQGDALRKELVDILTEKLDLSDRDLQSGLPDLEWLRAVLPGFTTELVAEGTAFYFFWNYNELEKKATSTTGTEDDQFVDLMKTITFEDNIEGFYPSYFLQTWDYGGSSNLGKGKHYQVLDKLNRTLAQSVLFETFIEKEKARLLEDILSEQSTFWNEASYIRQELKEIIEAEFGILTESDLTALKNRLEQFEDPAAHNIKVNVQGGGVS